MENRVRVCEIKKKFENFNTNGGGGSLEGKEGPSVSAWGKDLGGVHQKCQVKRSNAFRSDKSIAELKAEPWVGIELGEKAKAVLRTPLPRGPPPKKPPRTFKHPLPHIYYEPPVYSQPFKPHEYHIPPAPSQPSQPLHYMSTPIPEVKDVKPITNSNLMELGRFVRDSLALPSSSVNSSSEENTGCFGVNKGAKKKGESTNFNANEGKSWTDDWPRYFSTNN